MTAEATIRSYVDAFNRSDVAALASHYADKTSFVQPFAPVPLTTPEEVRAFEQGMFDGFSDVHAEVEWLVADGERAAAGVRITAVHTAAMPLPDGTVLSATGRGVDLRTAEHLRVDGDGKIVEHERYVDSASLLRQLTGG